MKKELVFFYTLSICFILQALGSVYNLNSIWDIASMGLKLQIVAGAFGNLIIALGMFITARQMQKSQAVSPAFQEVFTDLQKADVKGGKKRR